MFGGCSRGKVTGRTTCHWFALSRNFAAVAPALPPTYQFAPLA